MPKVTLSWQMLSEKRLFDEKIRCGFWMLELDARWSIKCICEQNGPRSPASIEVHRNSCDGERIVAGTLEIHEGKQRCVLKKFICLLEDGCFFVKIDFEYSRNKTKPLPKIFLVTGEISISERTEASLDFTELVHLTNTDYSSLKQLSNDMEKLLLEQSSFPDVSLKCGPVSVPAHKSILSARSPVFKAMFSSPIKEVVIEDLEDLIKEVVIEGIEDIVLISLQAMLKCMYTGKIGDLRPSLAICLLFIAYCYEIECIESACSRLLIHNNMPMEYAMKALRLGDSICPQLKNSVMDIVLNEYTDYSALEKSKGWVNLKNKNPELALEILSAVVKFQEQKLKLPSF